MKIVELTEKEVAKARDFAFELIRTGRPGTFENYFIGTVGEIAYGKFTNQEVNFKVYSHFKGDGGADFKNTQIKTTTWEGRDKQLKVGTSDKSLKLASVQKYVLAHAIITNPTNVVLIGEISKENLIKRAVLNKSWKCLVVGEHRLDVWYGYDTAKSS
jgi:hypothetical protein